MRVGMELSEKSYLPEAYAYHDYLVDRGWDVVFDNRRTLDGKCDVIIVFAGWVPAWQGLRTNSKLILEYHSASTGRFPRAKNLIKAAFEARPHGRILLDSTVERAFPFIWRVPTIYREMGVDQMFFDVGATEPEFDLVYAGSVSGRPGLLECLGYLSGLGLLILLVGSVGGEDLARLRLMAGVTLAGRLPRAEVPKALRRAKAGLNYMPDIYPLNVQPSTKVLEYYAAGLGVVSTRYQWAEAFERQRGAKMMWLDRLGSRADLHNFRFDPVDVKDLEWTKVLDRSGFESFLRDVVSGAVSGRRLQMGVR